MTRSRRYWNGISDDYQRAHGEAIEREALAWGVWRIPESELGVLGDLAGRDVLELGCGGGQWTGALARAGVRVFGVDFSERQLAYARARCRGGPGRRPPLVQGDAERLPFGDACFDVVFCDHGATSFAEPGRAVAEAARVLRPGGLFAFCIASTLRDLCWDPATDVTSERLARDYFSLYEMHDGESVCYQLPYGAWIRLFRGCALVVEDLVELQAPEGATTSYADYVPYAWARRWPAESIWKLRKQV
jgi:SAM-dependent methyltransferase